MNELEQIKLLRRKLGLGQKELADKAGVSQSFIAKVESNNIEPTYNKAKRILEVLHEEEGKLESVAKELMHKKIIFADPEESVYAIIKKMKKHGISQVPVGNKNQVIGIVSESTILNNFDKNLANKKVEQIMSEVPPIVSLDTPKKVVIELLKVFSLILVGKQGEIKGIISKSDLLERI